MEGVSQVERRWPRISGSIFIIENGETVRRQIFGARPHVFREKEHPHPHRASRNKARDSSTGDGLHSSLAEFPATSRLRSSGNNARTGIGKILLPPDPPRKISELRVRLLFLPIVVISVNSPYVVSDSLLLSPQRNKLGSRL